MTTNDTADAGREEPEALNAACHCGRDPEGQTVWGAHCPIIEHRARSGARWRTACVELTEKFMAAFSAAQQENRILQAQVELERRVYDRLNICPDHRDKAEVGRCIVCDGEQRGKAEGLEQGRHD